MPLTFRKSIRLLPGVRLNFGKRTRSLTIGPKGFRRTYRSDGTVTTSADLPGPFGYRSTRKRGRGGA